MNLPRLTQLLGFGVVWLILLALALSIHTAAAATTYKAYSAYQAGVGAASFLPSDPANPRLLSDAQFVGQLERGTTLLGVYYGNQGRQMGQVRDMESWQAKKFAVVNLYTNWCDTPTTINDLFDVQLLNIWDNHNVPMISWEPFSCVSGQTPRDVEVRAAKGEYDAYLDRWAERLKGFLNGPDGIYKTSDDRRAYLRLGHEMNGDWYPWGAAMGRNAPSDYIAMWKHVKERFDTAKLDSTHVQWVWCVNHTDNGGFVAERYYPGDAFVDWVAIDGYNWGETQSWSNWTPPAAVYDPMIARLRKLTTKPLAIPEYATTSSTTKGASEAAKSEWISAFLKYSRAKDVRMVAWFNEDKETDWAMFGGRLGDGSYTGDGTYAGDPRSATPAASEPARDASAAPEPLQEALSPWLTRAGLFAALIVVIVVLVIRRSRSRMHVQR
jgi:mannan endo-1,4-beta-mannosidase